MDKATQIVDQLKRDFTRATGDLKNIGSSSKPNLLGKSGWKYVDDWDDVDFPDGY